MEWFKVFLFIAVLKTARYLLSSAATHALFWKVFASWTEKRRIQKKPFRSEDIRREIRDSLVSSLVFAAVFSLPFAPGLRERLLIYDGLSSYGWVWPIVSLVLLILVHDTYFYWMHRLIHRPAFFRRVHRVHHLSTNPTAFASFAFHPLEAVLEFAWILPLLFLLPLSRGSVIAFSLLALLNNVIGHLGAEIYPKGASRHPLLKWMNRPTLHNEHHRAFLCNYGLYFTFWDRIGGTLKESGGAS